MPSELVNRLQRFLDQSVARDVMALEHTLPKTDTHPNPASPQNANPAANAHFHWPNNPTFGAVMNPDPQSVVIHETSGWPSYASAKRFGQLFRCEDTWEQNDSDHRWYDKRGIGPQYFVDSNGTAFNLMGPTDLAGSARETWHAEGLNSISLGIENSDAGDSGVSTTITNYFFRLPKPHDPHPPALPNVPGRKLFAMVHPRSLDADLVLIWYAIFANDDPASTHNSTANDYKDSGDLAARKGWQNMLFTERNYRALALLCRLIAEQYGIPRNFPVLPYLRLAEQTSSDYFRALLLTYERRDLIATKLNLQIPDVQANNVTFTNAYLAGRYIATVGHDKHGNPVTEERRVMWGRFFGWDPHTNNGGDTPCFRGFISHAIDGNHFCPGPFFDWHRFAREVWDWWWYPFDFTAPGTDVSSALETARRPYNQARHDTPLLEYFFEAKGLPADYNAKKTAAALLLDERFTLAPLVPIYAMANGVIVAARMAVSDSTATPGFLLVRHEVFHAMVNGLVNFDLPPTVFWSLITYLGNAGFTIDATSDANPDWLNRFLLRLFETEAAVVFHTADQAKAAGAQNPNLTAAWNFQPEPADLRMTTGNEIEWDATSYRSRATDLAAGNPVLFPLESYSVPTPVRVILGDFLGFAERTPQEANGVQIEIFSTTLIDGLTTDRRASAWTAEQWWKDASAAIRHEDRNDHDLPADGIVYHYTLTNFLKWVNGITWLGERKKYGLPDPVGTTPPDPPVKRNLT